MTDSTTSSTLRRCAWLAYDWLTSPVLRALDRRAGIETFGSGRRDPALPDEQGRLPYRSSGWRMLRRALPPGSVRSDDVFVDLGAGMGRVVYQAAKDYPFARVVGVELSQQLTDVARLNIERNRHRLTCRDVEIVTADILSYELPDDATIVYLYNPFVGDLFRRAMDRVLASYDRRPRRLRLIYANPVEHALVQATGRARLIARRLPLWRPTRGWREADAIHEYEITPAREPRTP